MAPSFSLVSTGGRAPVAGFGFEELHLFFEDVEEGFFCYSKRRVWAYTTSLGSGISYTKLRILTANTSLFVSVFVSQNW